MGSSPLIHISPHNPQNRLVRGDTITNYSLLITHYSLLTIHFSPPIAVSLHRVGGDGALAEDYKALHDVMQLADVARPRP